ncbi:FAD-dependent oxidoreductase [Pseudophaeobacter sp.]|uniref:flavin monoamine oxidase family protein n=1 Tax=Pseudophaeobacter sp. TaxID=1971739 RepID=UPI0032981E85
MQLFDRRDVLRMSGLLGLASVIGATGSEPAQARRAFTGEILVLGAGAAGLAAGLHLAQQGVAFKILEAGRTYGGRMKVDRNLADFPVSLGAEWLHTRPAVLSKMAGREVGLETLRYQRSDSQFQITGDEVSQGRLGPYPDRKFVNSSWYDFYSQFITPAVTPHILFRQVVKTIDYSGPRVVVTTTRGKRFVADKLLITLPLKILQSGSVRFVPELPAAKQKALRAARAWPGIKVFFEFSRKFYPAFIDYTVRPKSSGYRLFYDAAYGQNSQRNILGFFAVGNPALPYVNGDAAQLALADLDRVFAGDARRHHRRHLVQNWSREPHIRSAYLRDNERPATVRALYEPVQNRLHFAGEAYTPGEDWGAVHNAALAAKQAVSEMLRRQ